MSENVINVYSKPNVGDLFSLGNSLEKKTIISVINEEVYFKIILEGSNIFKFPKENLERGDL